MVIKVINSMKPELKKALLNKMFCFSLIIGIAICILDVIQNAEAVARLTTILENSDDTINKTAEGFSLFVRWIAVNGYTFGNYAFYLVWPILAAIPYGWSYAEDRKSGVYNQVVTRIGTKKYFVAKYMAVFISGGLAIAIPVLVNLLINALVCPYCVPSVVMSLTSITNGYFLSELYYSNPWSFGILWCGVEFLWGGTIAASCLAVGTKFRHQVMVVIFPFVSLLIMDALSSVLASMGLMGNIEISPLRLAQAAPDSANPTWIVFSVIGICILVSTIFGYWQVVKREFS